MTEQNLTETDVQDLTSCKLTTLLDLLRTYRGVLESGQIEGVKGSRQITDAERKTFKRLVSSAEAELKRRGMRV